jgi:uncharacterized membrane protein YfhO
MTTLSVRGINEEVKNAFERAVLKKYGKKHTVMGLEVEKALIFYMSKGKTANLEDFQDQNKNLNASSQEKHTSPPSQRKTDNFLGSERGNVGMFAQSFIDEYGSGAIVTKEVLRKHMSRTQGLVSDNALKNRLNYMLALGSLEFCDNGTFQISEIEKWDF